MDTPEISKASGSFARSNKTFTQSLDSLFSRYVQRDMVSSLDGLRATNHRGCAPINSNWRDSPCSETEAHGVRRSRRYLSWRRSSFAEARRGHQGIATSSDGP